MATIPFYARLTIPAGTARAAPVEKTLHCAPGRLLLFRVYVPPGPRGEVSLWLLHQRSQVAPVPPSSWDNLDGNVMEYPLNLDLPINAADLTLVGISPNASFQHAVDFECLVETEPTFAQAPPASSLSERILALFG